MTGLQTNSIERTYGCCTCGSRTLKCDSILLSSTFSMLCIYFVNWVSTKVLHIDPVKKCGKILGSTIDLFCLTE